jgi:hypothetical protein
MTFDQIDQLVRKANPVPDLKVLEPVDASVLVLDQQRRTEMKTHDRVEVDQVPQDPRRNPFIGIAAAAAIVVGVLVFLRPLDDAPVAAKQPAPMEIATAFLEAYGAFDVDRASSYLAIDADLSGLDGGVEGWQLGNKWLESHGFKLLLQSCEEQDGSLPGGVHCLFAFHAIRSGEIGVGPFGGSSFDFRIQDGKIVLASIRWDLDEFSPQIWEPFAAWVVDAHPEDAAIMYTDPSETMQRLTEESIGLWEQRSREYVAVAQERIEAENIATAFVEAYGAYDIDRAASYLAADADLSEFNGEVEGMRLQVRWQEATGFQVLLDSCARVNPAPFETSVRCTYYYHGIRSEEIGLGPYRGSWFDLRVLDGKIVSVSNDIEFISNGFSSEVWEPFAAWVAETYPEDVPIMYTDARQTMSQLTEESIALWEQRTREYVEVATG